LIPEDDQTVGGAMGPSRTDGPAGGGTAGLVEAPVACVQEEWPRKEPGPRARRPGAELRTCYLCARSRHIKRDCPYGRACWVYGRWGHLWRDCLAPRNTTQACWHCRELGHLRKDCPLVGRETQPEAAEGVADWAPVLFIPSEGSGTSYFQKTRYWATWTIDLTQYSYVLNPERNLFIHQATCRVQHNNCLTANF
uniref:CCHC-type domain-containing protein n=1 Tax=Chelonoidis abingdonii TaxID=106734 RepID=A0A8C0G7H5_CHEAB